jgi:serine/threonine protein kinase
LQPVPSPNVVRFDVFEVDLRARELRKNGVSTGLPEQSIKILAMLLEHPGQVVLREQLRQKLWPNDTAVEFDHGINAAMNRLRQALGDSANDPHFIETLARRGYRWIAPMEWSEPSLATPSPVVTDPRLEAEQHVGNLIGRRVSHYRVLEVVGGGGMGLVYKAEDLKLGRWVALKFLPEELATDSLTLQRFEREAQTASSLNHPNICTIYGVEEHEGRPFIVMELLEGETLRELISRLTTSSDAQKPGMPLEKVLDIAIQIAHGLDAAHRKGIIHRDIKPANIFVTTQGQAKILDFGLAKLSTAATGIEAEEQVEDRTDRAAAPIARGSPIDHSLTRTGMAIGTAGYMSPEQVRGEKLDSRTDLFSLGLVLYELAAGQRAFSGETAAVVHNAILYQAPPPARQSNPKVPSRLEAIVAKALEKDRNARYQHASDIVADLSRLKRDSAGHYSRWAIFATGIFAMVTLIALLWLRQHPRSSLPDLKLRQLTGNLADNPVRSGMISPDGKYLAYADLKGIHLKLLETGVTESMPQPKDLRGKPLNWQIVQWFPDSRKFIANLAPPPERYSQQQHPSVWSFSISGTAPLKLRDDAEASAISPDGSQIAFGSNPSESGGDREVWQMGPNGEYVRKLLDADGESAILGPQWLGNGRRMIYLKTGTTSSQSNSSRITSENRLNTWVATRSVSLKRTYSAIRSLPPARSKDACRRCVFSTRRH